MAKGDTFDVTVGDEIEISFQLNLKRAEVQKRKDADQLTHVVINFDTLSPGAGAPPNGTVIFQALSPDAQSDPALGQVLPVTQDDPKFTRLFRVARIDMFVAGNPASQQQVRVSASLVPKEGEKQASPLPNDKELCKLRVSPIKRPGA